MTLKSYINPDLQVLNSIAKDIRLLNANWWIDIDSGEPLERNVGELLMLCVSELAEAMEGHRKNLPDDKLPHRQMFEVEIADTLIRLFDLAGGLGLDISGAVYEKIQFNQQRADHQIENRKGEHGKNTNETFTNENIRNR